MPINIDSVLIASVVFQDTCAEIFILKRKIIAFGTNILKFHSQLKHSNKVVDKYVLEILCDPVKK